MSGGSAVEESDRSGVDGESEDRLVELMEEFRRRQRESPELVVRPWWTSGDRGGAGGRSDRGAKGFVVEYCPRGVDSVDLGVRRGRVRLEGPGGLREARLDLADGWHLEGEDLDCPELVANHLLSMADGLLEPGPA